MKNDLAQEILLNRTKRVSLFRDLPPNSRGFVLLGLPNAIQRELMKKLNNKEIVQLGDYLDPDEVTDLLQRIPKKRRRRLLKKLGRDIKKKVEFLLKFDSRTAAGLMSLDYIEIRKNKTFEDLSKIIRKHEKRTGKIPTILVVEEGFLVGELPFYTLAISKRNEKINKYIAKVPSVKYDMDENGVISLFKKNPHNKIIVLDSDYSILGVIYSDDILKFIENQSANNLRDFAGISDEEDVLDSAFIKVKNRYKWLIVNLGTAFFAAMIVSLFKETISAFVLLAVYMPIVAGMGGNAGTQTLAVMVRGLALKEVNSKTAKKVILNEVIAGGVNGIINGLLVAGIAVLWNKSPVLGLIIGLAMVINLIIAGFFGAVIPIFMKKMGKDPASSATIFITTATDVFGFFVFLQLATIMYGT
ncbi:magnesium transporter [bacterium]|nr:magnesium transporter [bacterium]